MEETSAAGDDEAAPGWVDLNVRIQVGFISGAWGPRKLPKLGSSSLLVDGHISPNTLVQSALFGLKLAGMALLPF